MREEKSRCFRLDGDEIEVKFLFDPDANMYFWDFPDFQEAPRLSPRGRRWVNATRDDCPLAEGEYNDCGSCRFYKAEHPGDLIGVCENDLLSMARKEEA